MLPIMGKKTAGVLLAGAWAALLVGCSGHQPITEDEYLQSADGLASFSHMSDAALVEFGKGYCDYLREFGDGTDEGRGRAAQRFLAIDADQGGDTLETAIVLGYAVQRYCPEFRTD